MLKNHNHDLVHQLSETSDSIWRMKEYLENANGCDSCQALWNEIMNDCERHADLLKKEIARHVGENRFE